MLAIIICVGKLKEREYERLCAEYEKRLSRFCRVETASIAESRLPDNPSDAQIAAALLREEREMRAAIPKGAYTVALDVAGTKHTSPDFAKRLEIVALTHDKLAFIVGGSHGLSETVKRDADLRLSFSDMTFPHHLFRVMLLEQLYRAFTITAGTPYQK